MQPDITESTVTTSPQTASCPYPHDSFPFIIDLRSRGSCFYPLCACGCGKNVECVNAKWLRGHVARGKIPSQETREKISKGRKGKKGVVHTEEFKQRLRLLFKNRYFSPETRKRISEANKGKHMGYHHTKESKEKLRLKALGRKHTQESIEKMRAVQKGHPVSEAQRKRLSECNKGKKLSSETKAKISIASKNFVRTREWCEKISEANKGRVISLETRAKLSEIAKTKVGVLASNWQGGKSFDDYSPLFNKALKTKIKNRDGNKCRNPNCEDGAYPLYIHHIDYNKKNSLELNLISLCNTCHAQTSGKKRRLYWQQYYTNLLTTEPFEKEDSVCDREISKANQAEMTI